MGAPRRRAALAAALVAALGLVSAVAFAIARRAGRPTFTFRCRNTVSSPFALHLLERGSLALIKTERGTELWSLDGGGAVFLRELVLEPGDFVFGSSPLSERVLVYRPNGHLRVVSARSGHVERDWPLKPGSSAVALSPSGDLVAVEVGQAIEVRRTDTGAVVRSLPYPKGIEVAEESGGSLSCSFVGDDFVEASLHVGLTTYLWTTRIADGAQGPEASARLAGDELLDFSGSGFGRMNVFPFDRSRHRTLVLEPFAGGDPLLVSASGADLLVANRFASVPTIELFSTSSGKRRCLIHPGRTFEEAALSADGDRVAVRFEDGTVEVWDVGR
jgi:hypothetical protein